MGKKKDQPSAPAPGEKAKTAGVVRVALETETFNEESANALAFMESGMVSADRREVAASVRLVVLKAVGDAVEELSKRALLKYRQHVIDSDIAEAEAVERRAIEAANAMRAKRQGGNAAGEPSGEVVP